jgi:PKD repeat protein
VANAGADQLTQTLTMLNFTGAMSNDPDGSIVLASWSFGDGATAGGLNVAHSYTTAGTYTATLTVIDNNGASDTDTATVTVQNRPPNANAGPDETSPPNASLTLNGSGSSDPDGSIVTYAWNFGDGTTGTGAMPGHSYTAPGTYTAWLTVTDNNGASASDNAVVTVSSTAPPTWARGIGASGSDGGYAIVGDAAGNTIVGGVFRAAMTVGSTPLPNLGGADWFLVKYGSTGNVLWAKSWGGPSEDLLDGLAVDANGDVIATGRFSGTASFGGLPLIANGSVDMVVAKFNGADGTPAWQAKNFGGAYDDAASAVATDGQNNVYFTGYFRGSTSFGGATLSVPFDTDLDVFLVKLNSAGVHQWSKNFTNSGNDRGYGIAADTNGNVAITGSFSNTIDFGGGPLTSANGMTDVFVARFSTTGTLQWARNFGAPDGSEGGYGTAMDASGNVFIAAYAVKPVDFGGGTLSALGASDAIVAKYSATSGAHMWSRRLGGSGNDYAYSVAVDGSGNVFVAGAYEDVGSFGGPSPLTAAGLSDAFVTKYGPTGSFLWQKSLGGTDDDLARSIGMSAGYPVTTGYFYASGSFNGTTLTSGGTADAFVVRIAP